jgi:Fe-Mn family superoxide dismutase
MEHKLPELPYAKKALEPHISAETLEYHHGKHHATYVSNLNNLIRGAEFEEMSLEDIIMKSSGGLFNNAAQTWNHSFYWKSLKPGGSGEPAGALAEAIKSAFGSFEDFKKTFTQKAVVVVRESQTRDPGWTIDEALKSIVSGGIIGPTELK